MALSHTTLSHNPVMAKEKGEKELHPSYQRMMDVFVERGNKDSQTALGAFFGIDQTAVRKWEVSGPPLTRVRTFCDHYEVCPNWILSNIQPKYPPSKGLQDLIKLAQKNPKKLPSILDFAVYKIGHEDSD